LLSFGAESFVFQFLLSKNINIKIYRTIILSSLYGCENWPLSLREERRLRVCENRVLRIFGPEGDRVTGEWRKLCNEELPDLYSSPNTFRVRKSRRMKWAEHLAYKGEGTGAIRILARKPEGRRPLGTRGRRWDDNIKTDLQQV